jgi:hypothetical protein
VTVLTGRLATTVGMEKTRTVARTNLVFIEFYQRVRDIIDLDLFVVEFVLLLIYTYTWL